MFFNQEVHVPSSRKEVFKTSINIFFTKHYLVGVSTTKILENLFEHGIVRGEAILINSLYTTFIN